MTAVNNTESSAMTLSIKTKESIKTALAMTIAYGIALSMDWDRPYWAGFAGGKGSGLATQQLLENMITCSGRVDTAGK